MEKLKFNPNNKKYFSDDFIKGFECGTERQFNADTEDKTAEWIKNNYREHYCSKCGISALNDDDCFEKLSDFCPFCGRKMLGV